MEFIETDIPGLLVLKPKVFCDARGYFFESYSAREFNDAVGAEVTFLQDNESSSARGVIRGLHFQLPPFAQAKLIRCISGKVIDVALDLRTDSPTFGKHFAIELSAENHMQLFIPRGFAHGFAVLSDVAVCQYKCDNYYAPSAECGISALDESLGIDWGIDPKDAILSEKDKCRQLFSNFDSPFKL